MSSEDLSFFDAPVDAARQPTAVVSTAQYLAFSVSKLELAVSLQHVSEIIPYERVSQVLGMPSFVRGVVQLRGRVIPIVDLAIKLGREPAPVSKRTCLLMLELESAGQRWPLGIVTDGVATLIDIDVSQLRPPPRIGSSVEVTLLEGLLPGERGMMPVLALQRIFAGSELAEVSRGAADLTPNVAGVSHE